MNFTPCPWCVVAKEHALNQDKDGDEQSVEKMHFMYLQIALPG
jgi:hypothetical protein